MVPLLETAFIILRTQSRSPSYGCFLASDQRRALETMDAEVRRQKPGTPRGSVRTPSPARLRDASPGRAPSVGRLGIADQRSARWSSRPVCVRAFVAVFSVCKGVWHSTWCLQGLLTLYVVYRRRGLRDASPGRAPSAGRFGIADQRSRQGPAVHGAC